MPLLQMPASLVEDISRLGHALVQRNWLCATAESCTGGLLGASLTAVPGASAWFSGGIMAYANAVKVAQLHVPAVLLMEHGAVSEACVLAMAKGLCTQLCVDVGISISGIAGPQGGSEEKPVGTVWLGFCVNGKGFAKHVLLQGDREAVRSQAVVIAVQVLLECMDASA